MQTKPDLAATENSVNILVQHTDLFEEKSLEAIQDLPEPAPAKQTSHTAAEGDTISQIEQILNEDLTKADSSKLALKNGMASSGGPNEAISSIAKIANLKSTLNKKKNSIV